MRTVLGTYHAMAQWAQSHCARPLSFLDDRWSDPVSWRAQARARVQELLAFSPPSPPLDPRTEDRWERDGVITERVSWAQPFGPRTEAFFLLPAGAGHAAGAAARLPGMVALHDHSAFYWFGKEKITAVPSEPALLRALKDEAYGGASWATELARRGYAVLAPDSFLWGSRRLDPASVTVDLVSSLDGLEPGTEAYIRAYNTFLWGHETLIAKTLFLCGTTWTGVMAWEDRRAVDYLLTRPEVDPRRLGCGGLSGGGLRSIYLSALDERITCAVCAGFMTTLDEMPAEIVRRHTWMFHVPNLAAEMDLPDLVCLHAPAPLLVQYNTEDPLWTLEGQRKADAHVRVVYQKVEAGARGKGGPRGDAPGYRGVFYPGPHKFDRAMQADAFAWLDRWLR